MPLTNESIHHIKNAGVVPLGVQQQFSINEKGERSTKIRVTYDCYFPGPSEPSVNNLVLRDTLQPCFYRFFLLRVNFEGHLMSMDEIMWSILRRKNL